MSSYEALQKEFNEKVEYLRKTCKHPKISDWTEEWWAPGHSTGCHVQYCEVCGFPVHQQTSCTVCSKIITDNEIYGGDGKKTLFGAPYCKECAEQGDKTVIEMNKWIDDKENYTVIKIDSRKGN